MLGKRPPNFVEVRVASKGRVSFDKSPLEGKDTFGHVDSGVVVVEYDVLTPHPKTATVTFRVTHARYTQSDEATAIQLLLRVTNREDTIGTTIHCPLGTRGELVFGEEQGGKVGYELVARPCGIDVYQPAVKVARNSRVHVTIDGKCLRTVSARTPICGGLKLSSGTYRVDQALGSTHFPGTFDLTVTGNQITGTGNWSCCPGPRHDPLTGTVNGTHVVIMRDCTGQGYVGECKQQLTGTLVASGRVEGTWKDVAGSTGSGTFTLVKS